MKAQKQIRKQIEKLETLLIYNLSDGFYKDFLELDEANKKKQIYQDIILEYETKVLPVEELAKLKKKVSRIIREERKIFFMVAALFVLLMLILLFIGIPLLNGVFDWRYKQTHELSNWSAGVARTHYWLAFFYSFVICSISLLGGMTCFVFLFTEEKETRWKLLPKMKKLEEEKHSTEKSHREDFYNRLYEERKKEPNLLEIKKYIFTYPHKNERERRNSKKIYAIPPHHAVKDLKFFTQWLVWEMKGLTDYLELLGERKETKKTSVELGNFLPNYTPIQKAILRDKNTDGGEVLRRIARQIQYRQNAKPITNQEQFKKEILQSYKISTAQMGYTSKSHTETFFLPRFRALVPFGMRKGHAYILGGSGSGKSELIKLFLYNDVQQPSGNLVLDPHGELALEISALDVFRKHPDKLVYITPQFKDYIPHYNPLEYRYHRITNPVQKLELIKTRAAELANAFAIIAKKEFTMQMRNMVKSCLVVLLHYENMTLGDLMEFMDDDGGGKYVRMARKVQDPHIRNFFKEGGDFFGKNYESSKKGVRARIYSLLTSGLFSDMVNQKKSTFDLIQALRDGRTVIVDLKKGKLSKEGMQAVGAFLLAEVVIWGFTRESGKGRSVFVYLDEVQNFVSPMLAEALEEIRKYKIHFTMANQGLYQFGAEGLPDVGKAIMNNTKIKFAGLVQRPAEQTEMTKATGGKIDIAKQQSELGRGRWVLSLANRDSFIMSADEFLIAGDGLQVLGKNGYLTQKEYKALIRGQVDLYYHKKEQTNDKKGSTHKHKKTDDNNDRPQFDKMI